MQQLAGKEAQNEQAALKIQKLWRSYTNRKIYKYYRDIIYFKCKGNPAKLLKGINPLQAHLLEPAAGCHIRFRLGGQNFPPNIYYKIFARTGIVDINAFAPRDYASLPRNKPSDKLTMQEYKSRKEEYEDEGWYLRADNNGWRPISHKMFDKADYIELYSANKVRYYHHKKEKRVDKCSKKARIAKLRWLQNLYKQAKEKGQNGENPVAQKQQQEELEGQIERAKVQVDGLGEESEQEIQSYNPLQNPKLVEIEDEEQFEREVQKLIDWSQNLDYNEYAKQWFQLSTSQPSSKFVFRNVNASAALVQGDKKEPKP